MKPVFTIDAGDIMAILLLIGLISIAIVAWLLNGLLSFFNKIQDKRNEKLEQYRKDKENAD